MSKTVGSGLITLARPSCEAAGRSAIPSLRVAAGLATGTLVAVGLARFAYSLLLPAMQSDLHWTYAQAGTLNAAISIGYMIGAMLTPRLEKALGSRGGFIAGMLATATGLFITALFRDYIALLVLRFATGLALGPVFIGGYALAARAGAASGRSTLFSGVYGMGVGLGIVLTGLILPQLVTVARHWPEGWLALGLLTLIATAVAVPAVRRSPSAPAPVENVPRCSLRFLTPIFLAMFAYGAGYFALVTFIIAFLRASGYGHARILDFWIVAGAIEMLTMIFWGNMLARFRGGWGVALTNGLLIVSAVLLLVWHDAVTVMLTSVLFGASVLASGLSLFDYPRRLTPPEDWTRLIAALTAVFCLGQTLGPVFCGWLSDLGGLRVGILAAAGLLFLSIVAALAQRGKPA
ncbi:MAG TPA: YbfB/YjiJ family MFS transporter [Acidiphilium sp.]